jgi:hypothetical protein
MQRVSYIKIVFHMHSFCVYREPRSMKKKRDGKCIHIPKALTSMGGNKIIICWIGRVFLVATLERAMVMLCGPNPTVPPAQAHTYRGDDGLRRWVYK